MKIPEFFTTLPGILIISGILLLLLAIILFIIGNKKAKKDAKKVEATPVEPVAATPVVEATPVAPVVEAPVVEPTPVAPVVETPVVEEPTQTFNFDFQISQPTAEQKPAYGGVNPAETISMPEEKPVTIYGGADPLANTQSFPKVETPVAPYNGQEIKTLEPVSEVLTTDTQPAVENPEMIKFEGPTQF